MCMIIVYVHCGVCVVLFVCCAFCVCYVCRYYVMLLCCVVYPSISATRV